MSLAVFQRWTIRRQLLVLAAVAVLPLLVYAVIAIREQATDYRRGAVADARSLAHQIAARIDDHIVNVDSLLVTIGEAVSADLGAVEANDARLRRILAGLPKHFSSISVLTTDGRMVNSATATIEERSSLDFSDRSYFRNAIATQSLAVSEPIQSRTSRKWIVILARPLLDEARQMRGVVSISMQLDVLQNLLVPDELPAGSVLTVVSDKGVVLARTLESATWIGRDLSGSPQVMDAIRLQEGVREAVAADGVARLAGFSTARQVPWLAYVGIPVEVAVGRESANQRKHVLLVLGSLLVAGGCAWYLARRITRPLKRLREAALRFSAGDLDHRVEAGGSAEATALGEAFNRMARDLAADMAARHDAEERGRRLSRFNAALSQTNRVIARRADPQTLFDEICRICVEQGHAVMSYVATLDGDSLVPVARAGLAEPFLADITRIALDPAVPEGRVPIATAFRDGRPYICNDLFNDPNTVAWRHRATAIGAQATAAFPFRRGGKLTGVLSVHVAERDFFDEPLIALLGELCDEISFALDNHDRDEARSMAEQEAVAGFDRFQRVFRTAPMPMVISGVESCRLVAVNDAFCSLFGYSQEEAIGRTSPELALWMDPEDRERNRQTVLEHTAVRYEAKLRARSGAVIDAVLSGDVIDFLGSPSILTVVTDITERKRVEEELRQANERLHVLSMRLLEVQEQERAAIARELHDEIGQSLTALKLMTQSAMQGVSAASAQKLVQCVAIADHTLAQTRNLTLNLRPPQLDHLGLTATLRDYLGRIAEGAGFATSFSSDDELRVLDRGIATTAFRVAQEALTNAARHASARTVGVEMNMRNGELMVAVSDDGCGYDPMEARERALKGGSMGLLGMEERVALAGGKLRIVTRPGQGTRVQATFPLGPITTILSRVEGLA